MNQSRDRAIGRAIAAGRGSMSQQALADAMRSRGWKWSQATVWSVEKGDRPVRLAEATDLVEILGVDFSIGDRDPRVAAVDSSGGRAAIAWRTIEMTTQTYLLALEDLRRALDDASDIPLPLGLASVAGWLDVTAEAAVKSGREQLARGIRLTMRGGDSGQR